MDVLRARRYPANVSSLSELLRRLLCRSHGDMMTVVDVADRVQWNQRSLYAWDRAASQADAMFKDSCPDVNETKADEMGNVFINAGLMATDESTQALLRAMGGQGQGSASNPQPAPSKPSLLSKALWPLATAALGGGIAFAASQYLATDANNEYEFSQQPITDLEPEQLQ